MGTLVTKPLLKGIARMAAASPRLRQRAEVEFFGLECRSALNREPSGRLPFAWTLNPYRAPARMSRATHHVSGVFGISRV